MPIRPENRDRYGKDWHLTSERIRFGRAQGRCECRGQCYDYDADQMSLHLQADGRCGAVHGLPIAGNPRRSPVVLTVAHLDHDPEHSEDDNLLALCQACHLRYDRFHHAETRRARQADPGEGTMLLW